MKKILILCALLLTATTLTAAPVRQMSTKRVQPSGDTLYCYVTGDEFFHRLHDAKDYTIVQNRETGWYVYAQLANGVLVPTAWVAGETDPAEVGLTPGLMPSQEVLKKRHAAWEVPEQYRYESPKTSGSNHGTLNNIVIFIRFSDETTCTSVTPSVMDSKFNDSSANAVSLYSYLKVASYNNLRVVTHFYPALSGSTVLSYQDSLPRGYYQPWSASNPQGYDEDDDAQRRSREFDLLERAVNWVNANHPIPASMNIDIDNDGKVDNVCFVVSGNTDGWNDLLWPHKWSLYDRNVYINGKRVYTFNFQLAGSGESYFGVSTLCHEMTHTLGCPDLYHYYNYTSISPAGSWDLMHSNATPPQQTNSLFKYRYLNWFDSIPLLTDSGRYTIQSLATGPNRAYKIASRSSHQWYILEYRNTGDRFDSSIPNRGLLVWRYNDQSSADNAGFDDDTPHELWLFRPGSSSDFANGTISSAAFGVNGRNSFGPTTNPHPYLCNGTADNSFELTDISISNDNQSVSFTFHPLGTETCQDVALYPALQDFETESLECWTFTSGNSENGMGQSHGAGFTTSQTHSGTTAFNFSSWNRATSTGNYGQYLVSPKLTNHDSLQLTFYCRRHSTSYPETLAVRYSTTTNDTGAFTQTLWSSSTLPDTFQLQTLLLPPSATYVAFYYYANYQYYIYLDDITIDEPCGPVQRFPHQQTFERGDLGCWQFVSNNTQNDIDGNSNHAGLDNSYSHNGTYCFRFSSYTHASDYNQYLISPELTHSTPLHLQFYYKRRNNNYTENLRVKYSTTTDAPSSFTQTLWTASNVTSDYQMADITVPANAKYLALNYYSNYAYYIYVDDIQLTEDITRDTTYITIHDTLHITQYDTLTTWVHDTLTQRVTDTLYHVVNDTVTMWVHDTIVIPAQQSLQMTVAPTVVHDTIYLRDTTWVVTHDTVQRTLRDTTWITLRDTTWLTRHDTTWIVKHDTVYIEDTVGIVSPEEPLFEVRTSKGRIEILRTQGRNVQIYDLQGRCRYVQRRVEESCVVEGLPAGVYVVRVGGARARKAIVW